ncbi:snoRNA-binding rRNA-processing protein UTP6 [Sporobolomyces koalae]|uniref:snoRNA-binding rRNA-processing protein UTP6 n=1 Tax=Sporobolomyces koalae TaxID=500713 RepID=UPI0031726023
MEKVQLALERFLPELRDLEQRKVFSKAEINDIVARRRGFEVSLANGRNTKPLDYLRYIEYEEKLEKLRRARVIRLQLTSQKSRSDYSIQFHITQLHRLSVRRFPESLQLWDAYIAHALSQDSPLLVSRTLSAAISMHPTVTRFWILASRWESEGDEKGMGGGNTEGARRLCMRALRFLKTRGRTTQRDATDDGNDSEANLVDIHAPSELVWQEWIRLEVAFIEKLKSRQQILGLGKGKDGEEVVVRVSGQRDADGEGSGEDTGEDENEHEGASVDVSALAGEAEDGPDPVDREVEAKVLSGQEAILDGAIVKAVIDNFLKENGHSLYAYKLLLTILRRLPSTLRTSLLAHVYASLSALRVQDINHPSHAAFFHLYATRDLYDVPYTPPRSSKKRKADETETVESENSGEIKVTGERFVDAVGRTASEYWAFLKQHSAAKRGKGKGRETRRGEISKDVWERFAAWLEAMAEETEDPDLLAFLTANLSAVFESTALSPSLALTRLRLLHRTASPTEVLDFAKQMSASFGAGDTPPRVREQVWAARIETSRSSDSSLDAATSASSAALQVMPYSARLWDMSADLHEENSRTPMQVIEWYGASIRRALLTDALPPPTFTSSTSDYRDVLPRELLPRRFIHYLLETTPASLEQSLTELFASAPTLSLASLTYALATTGQAHTASSRQFRLCLHERIVTHPDARTPEWIVYAKELMQDGRSAAKYPEVLRRAKGQLKLVGGPAEVARFERTWEETCKAMEE